MLEIFMCSSRKKETISSRRACDSNVDCSKFYFKWMVWFLANLDSKLIGKEIKTPEGVALLNISERDIYLNFVGAKTRNMIRKAAKFEYHTNIFESEKYLSDIKNIWTSTPIRSGQAMSEAYLGEPESFEDKFSCKDHLTFGFGVFKESTLVGYANVAILGDIAIIVQVMGHKDYLKDGIMNMLFCDLQSHLYSSGQKVIIYLRMKSATERLEAFKRHVGFVGAKVQFRHQLSKSERSQIG